jgi:hypothetical protein
MTTPRAISYKLVKYGRKHPELALTEFEIPQVPGYRHQSHSNKSVAGSLMTTGYAVPLVLMNPYVAGGVFVDYLVRGRYPQVPGKPEVLTPETLSALARSAPLQAIPPDTNIGTKIDTKTAVVPLPSSTTSGATVRGAQPLPVSAADAEMKGIGAQHE